MCGDQQIHLLHKCSCYTNSYAPITHSSESTVIALAVFLLRVGAMSKLKKHKISFLNDDQKRLDISINTSHNSNISDKSVIQLVKLLAKQAAEEDYLQSIIQSDQDEVTS